MPARTDLRAELCYYPLVSSVFPPPSLVAEIRHHPPAKSQPQGTSRDVMQNGRKWATSSGAIMGAEEPRLEKLNH
ncbi:hypothetical protein HL42_2540 [Trichophyton rubrum]|nr:hypothetical protein HL42_2540 [Trichophyton rubrum]